ncbi:MAG: hypothetical protein SVN78_04585 [Deferribacterota bacterium]|nr:hypothetical protein [Deferribacterota bacterium]
MKKEEVLQLKKDLILISDYPEIYNDTHLEAKLDNLRKEEEIAFNKLTDLDRNWVNNSFNEWLNIYLNRDCSSCSSNCCDCQDL